MCNPIGQYNTNPQKEESLAHFTQNALSWIIHGSIHSMGKRFIFSSKHVNRIWVSPASYSMGTFPGVKQVECEADDTPSYSAKVHEWSYISMPLYLSMAWTGTILSLQQAL